MGQLGVALNGWRVEPFPTELRPRQVLLLTLLLTLAAGALRFYRVAESVHPDSLLWFGRAQRFWAALGAGRFDKTYQAPHPGVTLMWITGGLLRLHGALTSSIDARGLFALKLPGALVGTLTASLTFPLLLRCLGATEWRAALIVGGLLATEPNMLEQSRMAHLDMAALGLGWLGLLCAIVAYDSNSRRWAIVAGSLFGAACLTKFSMVPLPATLMLIFLAAAFASRLRDRRGLMVATLATAAALLTCFALWPALWTSPHATLSKMLTETQVIAERGHVHVIDGERIREPGVKFYWHWVLGITPYETGLAALLGVFVLALGLAPKLRRHYLWLLVSLVPLLVLIALASKKLTRYALPSAPFLVLLAGAGLEWLAVFATKRWRFAGVVAAALGVLMAARFARAAYSLPPASLCTAWPSVECGRPADMYFMRDIALSIREDWRAHGGGPAPRVNIWKTALMSPWLDASRAKSPAHADYLVVWDVDYTNPETGELTAAARRDLVRLGKELTVVRYHGHVVARVYSQNSG